MTVVRLAGDFAMFVIRAAGYAIAALGLLLALVTVLVHPGWWPLWAFSALASLAILFALRRMRSR